MNYGSLIPHEDIHSSCKFIWEKKKKRSSVNERPLKTRVIPDFTEYIEISGTYKVDVDNFLNSLQLLEEMWSRKFWITGTIRENRLQHSTLADSKVMEKQKEREKEIERGEGVLKIYYNNFLESTSV